MKVNAIRNINYKASTQTIVPRSQQQNNVINFEKERLIAQKADSVNSNPITSLGYKLYRTFKFISENESTPTEQLNMLF